MIYMIYIWYNYDIWYMTRIQVVWQKKNVPVYAHEWYQQEYEIDILKDSFVSCQKFLELITPIFYPKKHNRSFSFSQVDEIRFNFL